MIYIAHRGLCEGPNKQKENHPDQIDLALKAGFDVEIDVRYLNGKFYLGHDTPDYEVDEYMLHNIRFWLHCKNIEALHYFATSKHYKFNYFWHDKDKFTLTSHGYIWSNIGEALTNHSIMVMPEVIDPTLSLASSAACHGICSDYIDMIRALRT